MCLMRIFTDRSGFIEKELPKMDGKVLLLKLCPLKKAGTIINIVVTYKLRMWLIIFYNSFSIKLTSPN